MNLKPAMTSGRAWALIRRVALVRDRLLGTESEEWHRMFIEHLNRRDQTAARRIIAALAKLYRNEERSNR